MKSSISFLKTIATLATLSLCFTFGYAQGDIDHCELVEKQSRCFYLNSETLWLSLINELEQSPRLEGDRELQYALVECYYGLAGVYMSTYDGDKGVPLLEKAVKANSKLIKQDSKNANYHAMQSALYGMQIGFSPMKGMFLGSKSDRHVEKAIELDPNNGFAWSQGASGYYHTPSMFGGDIKEAVRHYQKAVELLGSEGELESNWLWLEAMTWLGQAYQKNGQVTEAKQTYERALEVFPGFAWIQKALLPSLDK